MRAAGSPLEGGIRVASGSRGAALALLLLLIAALSGLGTGVLTLARRQALAARTTAWVLQARLAAESGSRGLLGAWPTDADWLAVGERVRGPSRTLGESGVTSTTIRRLSAELFLVYAVGRRTPGPATSRVASAVWALAPASRVAARRVVVASGGGLTVEDGGRVDGTDTHSVPTGWDPGRCAPLWQEVDSLFPTGEMAAYEAFPSDPSPSPWRPDGTLRPFEARTLGQTPGLGRIPLDTLVNVAAPIGPTMEPDAAACDAPIDASGLACGRAPGIWGGSGRLEVSGGAASGVLAVDGDLLFGGDAHFSGWILASGDVDLRGDARVEGVVRAGGSVRIEGRAVAAASPCAALAVLQSAWLRSPRKMPEFSHLGPLSES